MRVHDFRSLSKEEVKGYKIRGTTQKWDGDKGEMVDVTITGTVKRVSYPQHPDGSEYYILNGEDNLSGREVEEVLEEPDGSITEVEVENTVETAKEDRVKITSEQGKVLVPSSQADRVIEKLENI